jgi:hypothetical protein
MDFIVLLGALFFLIYDGIGTKIKNKNAYSFQKWVDHHSLTFIRNFAFKSYAVLYPIILQKVQKTVKLLFAIVFITVLFKMNSIPIYLMIGCVIGTL